jgi:hypothetical protein
MALRVGVYVLAVESLMAMTAANIAPMKAEWVSRKGSKAMTMVVLWSETRDMAKAGMLTLGMMM